MPPPTSRTSSASRDFATGLAASAGPALGYFPVGASFGALAIQADWAAAPTAAMSAGVYAAAAQFVGLDGLGNRSTLLVIMLMLLINLRHVPISLAAAPVFDRFSLAHRFVLALGLTDESFALDLSARNSGVWYHHGIHAACWLSWMSGTLLGVLVGARIPANWVEFALPALFIALAADFLRSYPVGRMPALILTGVVITAACGSAGMFAEPLAIVLLTACYAVLTRGRTSIRHQEER